MQLSFYQTFPELILKTTCQLVEKCYHSDLKVIVLTSTVEAQEELNKLLWTYSQKQFIPHGSRLDPFPEKQPVYLTYQLENPNSATILVLVNAAIPQALHDQMLIKEEKTSPQTGFENFARVLIIYDNADEVVFSKTTAIMNDLKSTDRLFSFHTQTPLGKWLQSPNMVE